MIFREGQDNYISESGIAGFAEGMGGIEEALSAITSSGGSRILRSIPPSSAEDVTAKLGIRNKNIKVFAERHSGSSLTLGTNQPKKTGSFWQNIIRKLLGKKPLNG